MIAVIMRRWGDLDTHAYLLGVWEDEIVAIGQGIIERKNRSNQYKPEYNVVNSVTGFIERKFNEDNK